ncbi:MAG: hypothetical protein B7Y41_05130 [Hydrogenophilales bacterium 28-61-23]|nr:MAG: hypothetical protein B7Y41_05130 [Hydrogenophilales bacterium 28-61-23]
MNMNPELLFVTGASRSGTTMLNRVLGAHGDILGMNELHYFGDIWSPADNAPLDRAEAVRLASWLLARQANGIWGDGPGPTEIHDAEALIKPLPDGLTGMDVYSHVVGGLASLAGKRIACEQTPRNIFYAARILDMDESAKVIQLIRDPRAVIASQKNRWKRKKLGGSSTPWSEVLRVWMNYHPYTMAKLWVKAADAGEVLKGHPRFKQIRFEDLVSNPQTVIADLCRFIGVDFQDGMLNVPIVGSSQRRDQGKTGFSVESVDSWRKSLDPAELWMIENTAGTPMKRYNYEPTGVSPGLGVFSVFARYPLHLIGVVISNPRRAWIQVRALLGTNR